MVRHYAPKESGRMDEGNFTLRLPQIPKRQSPVTGTFSTASSRGCDPLQKTEVTRIFKSKSQKLYPAPASQGFRKVVSVS